MRLSQSPARYLGSIVLSCLLISGCGTGDDAAALPAASISSHGDPDVSLKLADPDSIIANPEQLSSPSPRKNLHPKVVITTSLGKLTVELDAEKASETVDNFLENYVERGFYTNTIFHYVEPEFIVLAGGYTPDLKLKETRAPIRNEANNGLKNKRGTIAMSRQADYVHSATSQFFFNLSDNSSLDHDPSSEDDGSYGYCVFGEVVEGLDLLDKIANSPVRSNDEFQRLPSTQVIIESVQLLD